jgi:hypothetical protein
MGKWKKNYKKAEPTVSLINLEKALFELKICE